MSDNRSSKKRLANQLVWHPTSQSLPAYGTMVLLSIRGEKKVRRVIFGYRSSTDHRGEHYRDERMDNVSNVYAWMPMPEAYHE